MSGPVATEATFAGRWPPAILILSGCLLTPDSDGDRASFSLAVRQRGVRKGNGSAAKLWFR